MCIMLYSNVLHGTKGFKVHVNIAHMDILYKTCVCDNVNVKSSPEAVDF